MRFLITGGAGFIGSHLSEELISRGHEVVALDNLSTGSLKNITALSQNSNFEFIQGNIRNQELVARLVQDSDGVFHLAAAVGVQQILDNPIESLQTNIQGTENVLFSASKYEKRVLLASTSEIYGKNDSEPLKEESNRILGSPLLSRWTYSEAKAIDESIARTLFESRGLKVQIVRLFNTVGPKQSPAYGMVIPRFFSAAMKNTPLQIYGDGLQKRVFCHVSDAISGIIDLWDSNSGFGEAFNLGGFEEVSIVDLASRIVELTHSSSNFEFVSYEKMAVVGFEDIRRRIPVTSKLTDLTGWRPKLGLSEILEDIYLKLLK